MDVIERVSALKIVPVVKLDNAKDAIPLAEALCEGNLPVAEITFRTDAAIESISAITSRFPHMLIGAGTVTTINQAEKAVDAGATFLVSAGFSRKIVEFAIENNVPIFPGTCTATDLMQVVEYNLPVAKFFPASQYGGLKTIKALSAPFPKLKFMPTGGINAENILEYLSFEKIIACGGSWMVNSSLIAAGDFKKICELTKQAVDIVASL